MRELVNLGLAVFDLAVLADDSFITLEYLPLMSANSGHQSRDHFAQLLSAQICQ